MELWSNLSDDQTALLGCGLALTSCIGLLFLSGFVRGVRSKTSAESADGDGSVGGPRLSGSGSHGDVPPSPVQSSRRAA